MPKPTEPHRIAYVFVFEDGSRRQFNIDLDPKSVRFIPGRRIEEPQWARLEHHRCTCCPLDPDRHRWCPVAVNVAEVVEFFKDIRSSETCKVVVVTPERTCVKSTSVMDALSSIMGVIMATSDCPIMDLFRPMARFHQPFATVEETTVRSASMYLLRQYFIAQQNQTADFRLEGLDRHYAKVEQVNRGFLARIEDVVTSDADNNALVILHSLSQILSIEIDYSLKSVGYLFTE